MNSNTKTEQEPGLSVDQFTQRKEKADRRINHGLETGRDTFGEYARGGDVGAYARLLLEESIQPAQEVDPDAGSSIEVSDPDPETSSAEKRIAEKMNTLRAELARRPKDNEGVNGVLDLTDSDIEGMPKEDSMQDPVVADGTSGRAARWMPQPRD